MRDVDFIGRVAHPKAQKRCGGIFDVIATNLRDGTKRVMIRGLGERAAEAFVRHAVMRRGVEEEFFSTVPAVEES